MAQLPTLTIRSRSRRRSQSSRGRRSSRSGRSSRSSRSGRSGRSSESSRSRSIGAVVVGVIEVVGVGVGGGDWE